MLCYCAMTNAWTISIFSSIFEIVIVFIWNDSWRWTCIVSLGTLPMHLVVCRGHTPTLCAVELISGFLSVGGNWREQLEFQHGRQSREENFWWSLSLNSGTGVYILPGSEVFSFYLWEVVFKMSAVVTWNEYLMLSVQGNTLQNSRWKGFG